MLIKFQIKETIIHSTAILANQPLPRRWTFQSLSTCVHFLLPYMFLVERYTILRFSFLTEHVIMSVTFWKYIVSIEA